MHFSIPLLLYIHSTWHSSGTSLRKYENKNNTKNNNNHRLDYSFGLTPFSIAIKHKLQHTKIHHEWIKIEKVMFIAWPETTWNKRTQTCKSQKLQKLKFRMDVHNVFSLSFSLSLSLFLSLNLHLFSSGLLSLVLLLFFLFILCLFSRLVSSACSSSSSSFRLVRSVCVRGHHVKAHHHPHVVCPVLVYVQGHRRH